MSSAGLPESEKTLFANRVNEAVRRALSDRYLTGGNRSTAEGLAAVIIEKFTDCLVTVEKLMELTGNHSNGIYNRFKCRFGMTPGLFLEEARFLSAFFLLRLGLSVHETDEKSGFLLERKLHRVMHRALNHGGREIRPNYEISSFQIDERHGKKSEAAPHIKGMIDEIERTLELDPKVTRF